MTTHCLNKIFGSVTGNDNCMSQLFLSEEMGDWLTDILLSQGLEILLYEKC